MSRIMRAVAYGKTHGGKKLARKALEHGVRIQAEAGFENWLSAHLPSEEELKRQEKKSVNGSRKFSVLVPVYRTPEVFLREMIESVQNQSYPCWELCIADGSDGDTKAKDIILEYAQKDKRIRYRQMDENAGISGNTNAALEMAEGDFVCLLDHDDVLAPHALYELNQKIQKEELDMVYSDEDKTDSEGRKHFQPHFKPEFNLDLLRSNNYICHLFCVKRSIALNTGGFSSAYDGAQDYDFILRCIEQSDRIGHVPKILYHWRCHEASTAVNPESKRYAYEAGKRAVADHLKRCGLSANVYETDNPGFYRVHYAMPKMPKVTILVNGAFTAADANWQRERLLAATEYPDVEVCSGVSAATALRRILEKAGNEKEWILFLDRNCFPMHKGWLRELMSHGIRPDAGCVTGRIYNERKELLHAGEVLGMHGLAASCPFRGYPVGYYGYMHKIALQQDCSVVSGVCMLIRSDVLAKVGCDKRQKPGWDVELSIKVQENGLKNIYTPFAVLEYKGKEEKMPALADYANAHMEEAWAQSLGEADRYYHPELSVRKGSWRL